MPVSLSSQVQSVDLSPPASPDTRKTTQTETRISIAFFLVGFASFSLIYCVQPLLGDFTRAFAVSPTHSALALSLTTGLLAVSILLMSALSERFRPREVMFVSMAGAALLTLAAAFSPSWPLLLLARATEGAVLGGVPAIAMATLAHLIDPRRVGRAMGIYVGGTAFGGMMGRVAVGAFTEFTSWRLALALLAGLALLAAVGFRLLLPPTPPRRTGSAAPLTHHARIWWRHLTHARLLPLFALGFLNLGVFVAVLNFVGFRLTATPYHLSQTQLSLLFTMYLFGVVASPVSGSLADRYGRPRVLLAGLITSLLGLLLTLTTPLLTLLLGLVLMTTGFFITHSVASSWVSRTAPEHGGHASALYLLAYYLGSSVIGYAAGGFWTAAHWGGVVAFTGLLLLLALGLAWRQARR